MTEFGDTEPADVYAVGGYADPLQIAIRLHEIRHYLASVNGEPFPRWHELTDDDRALAVEIMAAIVAWLRSEGTEP